MLRRLATTACLAAAGWMLAAGPAAAQGFIGPNNWSAGGQALYWTRSDPQTAPGAAGLPIPTTNDLSMDWEPGAEFWLGWQDPCSPWGMDLRYFWIEPYRSAAGTSLVLPIADDNLDADVGLGIGLRSFLQGAELSATYQANDWLSLMGGFRWIQLNETFVQEFSAVGPDLDLAVSLRDQVTNNLYGAQIGANARLFDLRNFSTNLIGKFGLYGNVKDFGQSANVDLTLPAPPVQFAATDFDSDGGVAFSTDARLQSELWLTPNVSITGGYQVLFLDGVLRGETDSLTPGGTRAGGRDSLLYHGAFLGLNFRR